VTSLLRTEAAERARLLTVSSMEIDLDLTRTSDFSSTSTITFACASPGAATFVDLAASELVTAELNGRELGAEHWHDGRLTLADLASDNRLVVKATMAYSSDGEGLHAHADPADGHRYLYAMSFLDAAPRWFACFDQPDLKAPYTLHVTVPREWTVAGNGAAVQVRPGRWELAPTKPLATYFVTLVAGPYARLSSEHDGIALHLLARRSLAEALAREADDIWAVTRSAFDAYHALFGVRYPFGDYVQAFVPDFNAGAMENPGCVTFRDQLVFRGAATRAERASRAGTIVHEMAHQWFGDLVTMRWWDDLWLNESFAEYMGHRVCSDACGYDLWTEFGIQRKDWGAVADQAPTSHPVALNGAPDAHTALGNFDGISYAKGAAVLRQLVVHLGDDVFLVGVRDYFARHAFGNAEMADLVAAWERAGGIDLSSWTQAWLTTTGMDEVVAGDGALTLVAPASGGRRTHSVSVAQLSPDGRQRALIPVRLGDEPVPLGAGGGWVPDALDETWARTRPDLDWGRQRIAPVEQPATRVVLYNALRDGVRNAAIDPALALEVLERELPEEPDDLIVGRLLTFAAGSLAGAYSPWPARAARRDRVAALARGVLDDSAPGSDRQLTALRGYLMVAPDEALLERWLAGRDVPAGLDLDDDLRWLCVQRAVMLGGPEQLIADQLVEDPSTAGRTAAVRARALVPTLEAKRGALDVVIGSAHERAYDVYATAEGLFAADDPTLVEPLVAPFFAGLARTAAFRTGWALTRAAELAFPRALPSAATLAAAEAALGDEALPGALRKPLLDGVDAVRRALASLRLYGEERSD